MNIATRVFGHAQVPNDIAMCPLLDLVNHEQEQSRVKFFLTPPDLNVSMIDVEIERVTKEELEMDLQEQIIGQKQENENGTLCQDLNQHQDEYPHKYFNYRPV